MIERTLVLLKPDAVARRLVGKIIARFEERGFWIKAMRFQMMTQEIADQHYAEHREKPFYPSLCAFMQSGPLVALVLEGPGAVQAVRDMVGKTNALESPPGTIRGDYGLSKQHNLIHASDSPASAEREIAIWFGPQMVDVLPIDGRWVTEMLL